MKCVQKFRVYPYLIFYFIYLGPIANQLQKLSVMVIPQGICQNMMKRYPNGVYPHYHICAGSEDGNPNFRVISYV